MSVSTWQKASGKYFYQLEMAGLPETADDVDFETLVAALRRHLGR